jgi:hypothetical protein
MVICVCGYMCCSSSRWNCSRYPVADGTVPIACSTVKAVPVLDVAIVVAGATVKTVPVLDVAIVVADTTV